MSDIQKMKKKISKDWRIAFPELIHYSQNKFYKIIGPLIIGFELVKIPGLEGYRPYFVCYPLWRSSLASCIERPIVLIEFYDNKGFQFSVSYSDHTLLFADIVKSIKSQLHIPFEGDVELESIYSIIDEYSKKPPLGVTNNSYLQALLCEAKLDLALCVQDFDKVQEILTDIKTRNWDVDHFKMWDVDVADWVMTNQHRLNGSESLNSQIELNKKDKKLLKLRDSELTQGG